MASYFELMVIGDAAWYEEVPRELRLLLGSIAPTCGRALAKLRVLLS